MTVENTSIAETVVSDSILSPQESDATTAATTPVSDTNTSTECPLVTETMIAEEHRLLASSEEENKKELAKQAQEDFDNEIKKQRLQRLTFLLEKSTIYANFLARKLEMQQAEQREKAQKAEEEAKRMAKEGETNTMEEEKEVEVVNVVQTRRGPRRTQLSRKTRGNQRDGASESSSGAAVSRKRKVDDAKYNITDYMDAEEVAKRRKQGEENKELDIEKPQKPSLSARQPSLVTGGVLRDYQLAGVEWLISLYDNGLNGILADEMGLGKTLQTISFLAYLREKGVWGPFLVVCPLSTLANWVSEFQRFTPSIPVLLYHGSIEDRTRLRNKKMKKLNESFPIIVTSYEIVMNDRKHLQKFPWKYIVVDEGHRIKNLNCKLIKELKTYNSANRLLLTGTPLQNSLRELWSLLNFLLPDIFDDLELFQSWFDFSDLHDENAQKRILDIEAETRVVSNLHHILRPFLLRRLKTDVEHSLPKKKEYIIYAPITKTQKDMYDAVLNRDIRNYLISKKALNGSDNLKEESENKKTSEDDNANSQDGPEASTVLDEDKTQSEDIEEEVRRSRRSLNRPNYSDTISDNKYFNMLESGGDQPNKDLDAAKKAAKEWAQKTATKEVNNLKLQNLVMQLRKVCNHPYLFDWPEDPSTGEPLISDELVNSSGKMMVLNRLLTALLERGHKVLIFSQMTRLLDILEDWMTEVRGWPCYRIDGGVAQEVRQQQIANFNTKEDVKVFLLSTRAGGLGINLTSADTVIIFDSDWNPQMDLQAQDRVHRIGQTKPVVVYRLITANSVESKILEKASAKRKLEKLVIHKSKFKRPAGEKGADDESSTLRELAEVLFQDENDKVKLANTGDQVISDADLERLLDRSEEAFARRWESGEGAFKEVDPEAAADDGQGGFKLA
ncbi:uncharacterized protein VTP21DRAFT_5133 [Calcarisporiella thermophila]|uniref:uncharacterized protein n=1 Tax=Calcarisporiella thermophila TaxID=911321 RepID=UPI0037444CBF